jgi:hypothetical protein
MYRYRENSELDFSNGTISGSSMMVALSGHSIVAILVTKVISSGSFHRADYRKSVQSIVAILFPKAAACGDESNSGGRQMDAQISVTENQRNTVQPLSPIATHAMQNFALICKCPYF